jgi:hypothetical protein
MLAFFIILIILVLYYLKIREQLVKDKGEKRWFFLLSFLTVGMALLVTFNVPVDIVMTTLNETLGEFSKQVIKL